MKKITNEQDYKSGYEILHMLTKHKDERLMAYTIDLKRNLRQYANKKPFEDVGFGFHCERRIIKDYGIDGYIEIVKIPEVFSTLEDSEINGPGAETFFKDFIEIKPYPSAFDCTGQSFTAWYKIIKRQGQFWAYHRVCTDT